jgi:predicted nucleotidyltransferase
VPARLSPQEARLLDAFASGVRARLGSRLREITLFGSRARGEARSDSDLDVLVAVADLERDERLFVIDLSADSGLEYGLVLSPLVVDAVGFRWDLPLGQDIRREGRAL